jgi:lysozyme
MELIESIKKHEGFRDKVYKDTFGNETIGFGTNLADGISRQEAHLLLQHRLNKAIAEVDSYLGIDVSLKMNNRQREALYELNYWIGFSKFRGFKKMIKAIKEGDFQKASLEMIDSKLGMNFKTRTLSLSRKLRG